ncbi:hypothetical protein HPB49_009827 [Dermacentor silvarum]|uniref:Uncharacterized protein n=1 Tax=Dermacentor silvarum TaxID=543639 RepID=A0ACB8DYX2_DERSI|nr:hypothetical protein HPB49_009827 [Dermacentor silvarum]
MGRRKRRRPKGHHETPELQEPDELCVLSDESSLAVADDEDSLLSSLAAPGMDHLVKGLEDHLELEPVKLCCETTEWLEPVPDVPVPELEHSANVVQPRTSVFTHWCSCLVGEACKLAARDRLCTAAVAEQEGSHNLPDEFKLDDKDFDVFRDVRGVRFHQKRSVPVIPSTPPQFPASPALDMGDIKDDIVDLNTNEKPIQDELQEVTLD